MKFHFTGYFGASWTASTSVKNYAIHIVSDAVHRSSQNTFIRNYSVDVHINAKFLENKHVGLIRVIALAEIGTYTYKTIQRY